MVANKIGRVIRVVKVSKRSMCLDLNVGRAADVLRVGLEITPENIPASVAGDGFPLSEVSKAGESGSTVRLHHDRQGRVVGGTTSQVKAIMFPQKAGLGGGCGDKLGSHRIGAMEMGAIN
jgi:hypothetical protein